MKIYTVSKVFVLCGQGFYPLSNYLDPLNFTLLSKPLITISTRHLVEIFEVVRLKNNTLEYVPKIKIKRQSENPLM